LYRLRAPQSPISPKFVVSNVAVFSSSQASHQSELKSTSLYPLLDTSDARGSVLKCGEFAVASLLHEFPELRELPPEFLNWVEKTLRYNLFGGKQNRGVLLVEATQALAEAKGHTLTLEEYAEAALLGFCVEMLQGWMLIADDVMDRSITRRGKPCWYALEEVGATVINDISMVDMIIYKILQQQFGKKQYYNGVRDLFLHATYITQAGQLLDLITSDEQDLEKFTYERWEQVAKYKTSFYSFYLPVALAMSISHIVDPDAFSEARKLLLDLGLYFQAQDDFLDWYGTPEHIGKVGTDIQDGKCSWLFVNAYHGLANASERAEIKRNYGFCEDEKTSKVKAIYTKLDLAKHFQDFEENSHKRILAMRPQVEAVGLPWSMFDNILRRIYKRTK